MGYRGIGRDVTARREVEATLRLSQERFKTVVTALLEGVVLFDERGQIVECNASAEAILGYPIAYLQCHHSLFPDGNAYGDDGIALPPAGYPPQSLTAAPSSHVIGLRRPDGERWVMANVSPLLSDGDKHPTGWVTTLADITALKLSQQEIRRLNVDLEHRVLARTAELETALRIGN
jgi:hypothetical protein